MTKGVGSSDPAGADNADQCAMAHSPFMLGDQGIEVRDDFLGSILRRLRRYADQSSAATWLGAAADSWLSAYDIMPPGCKNVHLQDWLTDEQRRAEFNVALEWVRQDLLRAAAVGDFHLDLVPFEETFVELRKLVSGS